MFLGSNEVVDKPCKDILTYPLQCFQEMFFATPAVVGTFVLSIGGFAVAVLIWGALLALALLSIYYVLKKIFRGLVCLLHRTRLGQSILGLLPFKSCLKKICCTSSQETQTCKPTTSNQSAGEHATNVVSKVNTDSKWLRASFRALPFLKSSSDNETKRQSPSKTPQRSVSRISALTPKMLTPKHLKLND